ncbi:transcriptional regulator with HTH domain and aminotransferase domain-containing protein [Pseudomonas sp. GM78]|uniref:MocR-like pyridoxine biosynthesis transcription factor PdxR n=1 Tax=Pseudomonas sp. GM78 TaxID=1144337 RepID=UPI000270C1BF|nr:PLP-dependent aminotransferase family protein [Pseudomonas sp. GM78]EJN19908.1 transcriptional regulator with HTH domain and aminotransferase domain-containing protein [Pseudomonas sp. GM78]
MTSPINNLSPLDPASKEPIYRQIYWRFRAAISDGVLAPGARIPAARALAKELGLARGTIDTAYSLLAAEGYIQSRGQAGTVVAAGLTLRTDSRRDEHALNPLAGTSVRHKAPVLPFQMALPALDVFPRKIWAQIGARCVRATGVADMANPSAYGLESLRSAIASYLQMARGIYCQPSQVFVTSGYRNTLTLIVHALLKPGDRVLVENPGYPPTRQLLEYLQIAVQPVAVDQDGMQVEQGVSASLDARAAVVTPAHQSPLCMSLSLPRRLQLLEWAGREQSWIIEDDYDGEYRYISRPLPALKSLDRDGRVLYAGTFSKVLFPGIRLAYLVVPPAQVERFEHVSQTFLGGCPELTQAIVTTFVTEGHFARHIQRMRKLYGERREAVVRGLTNALGDHFHIDTQPGGMHLILRLTRPQSDRALVERLLHAGIYAEALSECCIGPPTHCGLLLGFANIASQASAEQLGQHILALL